MKVSELIEELKDIDPDAEVVDNNNNPLYTAYEDVGYWDGRYDQLKIDESRKPFYSIVGMTVGLGSGNKCRMRFYSWQDVLDNDRDASVTFFDGEVPSYVEEYRKEIDEWEYAHLTDPLRPTNGNCANRLFIQFHDKSEFEKFKELFDPTVEKWREADRRCYQYWYPEFNAFRYYDLNDDQLQQAKIASDRWNLEADRFIFTTAPYNTPLPLRENNE